METVAGEVAAALSGACIRGHSLHFFRFAHFDGQVYYGANDALVYHTLDQEKSHEVRGDVDTE